MKRNTLNFWIDIVTFVVMISLMATGLLIHYVLPPGTGGGGNREGLTLWGWGRHDYGDIHFYLALALIILIIIHIWLHWSWVCVTIKNMLGIKSYSRSRHALYGVFLLVLLIITTVGGMFWAKSHVYSGTDSFGHAKPDDKISSIIHINGQNTLAQAAEIAGVPIDTLIRQLGLPEDVEVNEKLGRLKREYGFGIRDVRRILKQEQ